MFQCRTKGDFQVAFSDKLPDTVYAPVLMLNFIHSSSVLYLPAVVNVSKFGSMLEGFWHLAYSHKPTFSLSHTHIPALAHSGSHETDIILSLNDPVKITAGAFSQ